MTSLQLYLMTSLFILAAGGISLRSKPKIFQFVVWLSWLVMGGLFVGQGEPAEVKNLSDWAYFQSFVFLSFYVMISLIGGVVLLKKGVPTSVGAAWMASMNLLLTAYILGETQIKGLGLACLALSWLAWGLKWVSGPKVENLEEAPDSTMYQRSKFFGYLSLFLGLVCFSSLLNANSVQGLIARRLDCLLPDFAPWHFFAGVLLMTGCLMTAEFIFWPGRTQLESTGSFWVRAILSTVGRVVAQMVLLRWSSYWSLFLGYKIFFSVFGLLGLLTAARRFTTTRELYQAVEAQTALSTSFFLVLLPWGVDVFLRAWFLLSLWLQCWSFLMAGLVSSLLSSESDLFAMGGLRKRLPVTFLFWVSGGFLLAGFLIWAGGHLVLQLSAEDASWWALGVVMTGHFVFISFTVEQFAALTDRIFLGASRAHEWVLAYIQEMSWGARGLLAIFLVAFVRGMGLCVSQLGGDAMKSSVRLWVSSGLCVGAWVCGATLALRRLCQKEAHVPAKVDRKNFTVWPVNGGDHHDTGLSQALTQLGQAMSRQLQQGAQAIFTEGERVINRVLEGDLNSGTTVFWMLCLLGIALAVGSWRCHGFS